MPPMNVTGPLTLLGPTHVPAAITRQIRSQQVARAVADAGICTVECTRVKNRTVEKSALKETLAGSQVTCELTVSSTQQYSAVVHVEPVKLTGRAFTSTSTVPLGPGSMTSG